MQSEERRAHSSGASGITPVYSPVMGQPDRFSGDSPDGGIDGRRVITDEGKAESKERERREEGKRCEYFRKQGGREER